VLSSTKHVATLLKQTVHLFHAQALVVSRNLAFAVVSTDLSETSIQIHVYQVAPRVQNKLKVVIQALRLALQQDGLGLVEIVGEIRQELFPGNDLHETTPHFWHEPFEFLDRTLVSAVASE